MKLVVREKTSCRRRKETLAQVFSCEFCEISKKTFFYRTPLVAASYQKICKHYWSHRCSQRIFTHSTRATFASSDTEKFYLSFVKVILIETVISLFSLWELSIRKINIFSRIFHKRATSLCYLSWLKNIRCPQNLSRDLESILY